MVNKISIIILRVKEILNIFFEKKKSIARTIAAFTNHFFHCVNNK